MMWYKNICSRFFGLVTKHECDTHTDGWTDRQTDRITIPKTALFGWMKTPLGTKVDLGAGHILLDGFPALRERGTAQHPSPF